METFFSSDIENPCCDCKESAFSTNCNCKDRKIYNCVMALRELGKSDEEIDRWIKESFYSNKAKMVEKIRPRAVINEHFDMEFRNSFYAIDYYCPTCGKLIAFYKSDNACDKCGTFFDWGERKPEIKITRTVEW